MKAMDADLSLLRRWKLPDLTNADSKEDRGRILVVGGSREIPGAALLAGYASLRAGGGKLHIATAAEVAPALAIAIPEARVTGLASTASGEITGSSDALIVAVKQSDVLLVGPGMTPSASTQRLAASCAVHAKATILDAGALAAATTRASVITPHYGEMAALCDCEKHEVADDPAGVALKVARELDVVVALKGAVTHIANPAGDLWLYRGGSIGLGTSGSGDVLAGVIAGLVAQGATADQAAVWGVVLHGEAGESLGGRVGKIGFLAREIADEIPRIRTAVSD
jgi:ADP-dependent NAD(P)H-hydrate dehydratase